MNRPLTVAFLLATPLALLPSAGAGAQPSVVIDQRQAVVDTTVGGMAIGGASDERLAQTVTIGVDGRLTAVFLPVTCDSGELLVEIRDVVGGEPGTGVLADRSVRAAALPTHPGAMVSIAVGGALDLHVGDRIAIVLDNPSGACGLFQGPPGDSYGGGEAFFEALPNPPGWVPFTETETHFDLPFAIEMRVR